MGGVGGEGRGSGRGMRRVGGEWEGLEGNGSGRVRRGMVGVGRVGGA